MSTLSSASTLAQVQAAYDDNASYAEDNSVAKCKAFITACRMLIRRTPVRAVHGGRGAGEELESSIELIRKELEAAKGWLAESGDSDEGGAGGVRHFSFAEYRN